MGSETRHASEGVYVSDLKRKVVFGSEILRLSDFVFQFVDEVVSVVFDADEFIKISAIECFEELGW